jgi:hypothetical protein
MIEQRLPELFEAVDVSDAPPAPALGPLLHTARRSVRRRRWTAVAVMLLTVIALVGAVQQYPHHRLAPASPPSGTPTLPDTIAGYSALTAKVSRAPGGRAILIYEFGNGELINMFQPIALGADADTYRQIDAAETGRGYRPWLLSPDGTFVVMSEPSALTRQLTIVDLVKGGTRSVSLPEPVALTLLAISPDSRRVAYASVPTLSADGAAANGISQDTARYGTLAVTDLSTGATVRFPQFQPVEAVAFAPDGRQLAVQTKLETWIATVDGHSVRRVPMPPGRGIAPRVAWSPDGALLATIGWGTDTWQNLENKTETVYRPEYTDTSILFVSATAQAAGPAVVIGKAIPQGELLGWRSADRVLMVDGYEAAIFTEVPVDGSPGRVISRVDPRHSCELTMQKCATFEIRAATGLLLSAEPRAAGAPDRGPWPPWFVAAVLGVLLVVVAIWLLIRRRMRARAGT